MATILIVEDDPVMSRMYQRIFSIEGHAVVVANDGEDAIVKARELKPTLMLLDIMMPKMNGFQVLEKLKHDPETTGIPIVMLTNLAGTQEMENAMTHGAIKYLIKSELEPTHLTTIIREVLAGLTPISSITAPAVPPSSSPAVEAAPAPAAPTTAPSAPPPVPTAPPSDPSAAPVISPAQTPSPSPSPTPQPPTQPSNGEPDTKT